MSFIIIVFYMPMVYDHRSCLYLSVTAPGDRNKSMSISRIIFAPLFLHTSSLARIKGGAAHPSESDVYVCDLCNRRFSTQGSLKRHRESVHRQSAGFSCQVCAQRFYRKDHLSVRPTLLPKRPTQEASPQKTCRRGVRGTG